MKRSGLLFLLIAPALVASAGAEQLLWSDEFDSGTQPNPAVWSYNLGAGGWGNRELQEYTDDPSNVSVSDGMLKITVRDEGGRFTSGRIRTQDKVTFRYGTLEARIRMPDLGNGLWPAFWTMGNSFGTVGWPHCGELDVMEMGSGDAIARGLVNRRVGSAAHWEHNGSHADYGQSLDAPMDLTEDFHIFRMEWTPQAVTTFLDGQQIWEMDITPSACTDCSEFHEPHFVLLNVAVGGTYPGLLNASQITAETPAQMQVDYVRIYDNGHTELGGSAIAEGPVALGPGHSGTWYNPDQSGHGFSMEFGTLPDGAPLALIYWYNYDVLGNPVYFVGTGTPEGNAVEVEFISPVGMRFGEFDPDTVAREPAGAGRFTFTDPDHASFSYEPSDFSAVTWGHTALANVPLERLFAIPIEALRR